MKNIKCYFVAYRLLLSHMKGLEKWGQVLSQIFNYYGGIRSQDRANQIFGK